MRPPNVVLGGSGGSGSGGGGGANPSSGLHWRRYTGAARHVK